jgi:hypothetical protein
MRTPIWLTIAFFAISTPLLAQTTRDALIKQVTKETCDELSKTDFSNKSTDEFKITLGLVLVKVVAAHQAELKTVGVSVSDPQSLEKIGNDVGVQLVTTCPSFLSALTGNPNAVKELLDNEKASVSGSISGKLVKVVGGEFTYLQVEDAKGKVEKLWWLEYFEGSNNLVGDQQSQLNKPIKVNYVEKEMFNSTLKDYVKIKVITSIQ